MEVEIAEGDPSISPIVTHSMSAICIGEPIRVRPDTILPQMSQYNFGQSLM